MTLPASGPYILLDDARSGAGPARLYTRPVATIVARNMAEIDPALEQLRAALSEGKHVAGYMSYEAGAAFETRTPASRHDSAPLLWFGVFRDWQEIESDALPTLLADPRGAWVGPAEPEIDFPAYRERAEQVAALIWAGDAYQANLTFRASVATMGSASALYAALRERARAGYGALIETGEETILSLSPELFFSLQSGRLTARPMKGTAARGADPSEDAALARDLATDPQTARRKSDDPRSDAQ